MLHTLETRGNMFPIMGGLPVGSLPIFLYSKGITMFKSITATKLKAFQAYASSAWTQSEAEQIWRETIWKLGLKPKELSSISAGWAKFVLNGDATSLNDACSSVYTRVNQ